MTRVETPESRPPRMAQALLVWRLPPPDCEYFLGDLEEAFDDIALRRGPAAACRWYWREAARAVLQPWPSIRAPRLPNAPQDSRMNSLLSDLRFAFRMISRSPGISALVVLTLALGVGATSAIFSVVYPALFEAPAYPRPEQIMMVWERDRDGAQSTVGYLTFRDLEREGRSIESMAAMSYWQPTISGDAESERLDGQRVTQRFFHVLGVKPFLGRDFTVDEDRRGANRVAMLSYSLWQRRFASDTGIVGHGIAINGVTYTVAGVLPKDFESLLAPGTQIWAPLGYDASLSYACRSCRHLRLVARVKDGVSRDAAQEQLSNIHAAVVRQYPTEYSATGTLLEPIHEMVTRSAKPALQALLVAVGFVLLIACVNAANLLLGRALRRESEFAVRTALGAGRSRLARLMVTESLTLAVLAGSLGTLIAFAAVRWLVRFGPQGIPRFEHVRVDGTVLGFALLLALVTGVLASVLPALATSRADLHGALKSGVRGIANAARHRIRSGLVVAEIALAVTLLAGTALLAKSLSRLLAVDAGFEPRQRLTMEVALSGPKYQVDGAIFAFWHDMLDAVRAVPGVVSAGVASELPLGGNIDMYGVHLEDRPSANPELDPSALRYGVSPDYLAAMGIPLLRGRGITGEDTQASPMVLVINRTMADALFTNADPIGRRIKTGGTDGPWRTIVGIVGNARHRGLDAVNEFQMYVPLLQWDSESGLTLVARTTGSPAALVRAVRAAVASVDRTAAIAKVATMDELLAQSTSQRRFALAIFESFALISLVLAAAGIYGVLSATVSERTREIGIRTALGAPRERILGMVLRQGLSMTVVGFALGIAGAFALSRVLSTLLFGVRSSDPGAMLLVAATLLAIAIVACAIPAWRAARVDPLIALRDG